MGIEGSDIGLAEISPTAVLPALLFAATLTLVSASSCTLELKTIPNAPRTEVVGWLGTALKVKVHAPALEGRANETLLEFLAGKLGVPRRAVALVRGAKSRQKVVRIDGLALPEVKLRLGV